MNKLFFTNKPLSIEELETRQELSAFVFNDLLTEAVKKGDMPRCSDQDWGQY